MAIKIGISKIVMGQTRSSGKHDTIPPKTTRINFAIVFEIGFSWSSGTR
jgi:hypothetical protein